VFDSGGHNRWRPAQALPRGAGALLPNCSIKRQWWQLALEAGSLATATSSGRSESACGPGYLADGTPDVWGERL